MKKLSFREVTGFAQGFTAGNAEPTLSPDPLAWLQAFMSIYISKDMPFCIKNNL